MIKKTIFVIVLLIILAIVALILMFTSSRDTSDQVSVINGQETEESVANTINQEEYLGGGSSSFTIMSYGGAKDIKTLRENDIEYALTRNPASIGGLELALVNPFGTYYFAEDNSGRKIIFSEGDPEGNHGYDEIGQVSGKLLRDRNTFTEYFAAYPDAISAQIAGLVIVQDGGSANRLLDARYMLITNLNNNVSIIAEIDHRSSEQGVLMVSDAVRRELRLDDDAVGNLKIELVPKNFFRPGALR